MPTISRRAIVPFSAEQMFALVNAVEDYPKFLPWCRGSQVFSRDEDEVRARLDLAKGVFHKSFSTCNRLQTNKLIEIRLVDGPFDHLEGIWRFDPLDEKSCQVFFDMEFQVAGKLGSLAFSPIFQQIGNSLVDAFCKRAKALYGKE